MSDTFEQEQMVFGVQGLDLKRSLDLIPNTKLSRMTNVVRNDEGELTGRPGQTTIFTAAPTPHHSIGRLNNRFQSTFNYILGAGTSVWFGTSGALQQVTTGTSGNPLTFAPYHPTLSGDSWMYWGDSTKMGKVRGTDGTFATIGLAPGVSKDQRFRIDEFKKAPTGSIGSRDRTRFSSVGFDVTGATGGGTPGLFTSYTTQAKTLIDSCETATWTNNAGTGGAPTNVVDPINVKVGTNSLKLSSNHGAAGGAYYNFWAKAVGLNLNVVGGQAATDDDIIHLWCRTDRPDLLVEARIYFVVSAVFDTATVPGTDTGGTKNTDAYMKAFRPSDFTPAFGTGSSSAATAASVNTNFDNLTGLPIITDTRQSIANLAQQFDSSRSASLQLGPGYGAWTEFGIIGLPLHRRDFRRIGTDTTRSWGTVTGLVIVAQVSTNTEITIWLDDIYLTGGAGLDSSLLGLTPYDFRYRNYDPRTGAKSNPSPIQANGYRLDSLRQGIVISPPPYGDSNIRQQVFRRGGTLGTTWYYVGVNTVDGGTVTDTQSDSAVQANAAIVPFEIDNDQPITTVNSVGTTVLAQPLVAIWGPVMDILYGCGDPYRAGELYWCKPTQLDSWPAAYHVEACPPSEELMNGFAISSQPFVFSRERLFSIYPNLTDASQVTIQPTACTHGLVGRWAFAVGPGGCFFAAKDGVYVTSGGAEQSISDNDIRDLFQGISRNGYLPVDFNFPNEIRLAVHNNELWLRYRDTSGGITVFVYAIIYQFWRAAPLGQQISALYSDSGTTIKQLLFGGMSSGKSYTYSGTTDDGLPITAVARTGALTQGSPREHKLYGDFTIDADLQGNTVTVTPYINTESTQLTPTVLNTGVGRQRYYGDLGATLGRNLTLDISWTTSGSPPVIWNGGPSYAVQPHTTETRVTNWDTQGALANKKVKGIKIEANTFGVAKQINLQADGSTFQTITMQTSDRQVKEFSFPQQEGRVLRMRPGDTVDWILYQLRWIFDEEPQFLTRWETQETSNGIEGWQYPLYGHVAIRSTDVVTLTIISFDQSGGSITNAYPIASTGGAKQKLFIGFSVQKGIMFKYTVTSPTAFYLYREETEFWMMPWGGGRSRVIHPFGDDDLDSPRAMRDAALTAARPNA